MDTDESAPKGFSLKRWSRRKLEAARADAEPANAVAPVLQPADAPADAPAIAPGEAAAAVAASVPNGDPPALPPVESLTIDSDFTAFLQPKVDEALKRQALKQLFRDPRFNVMDGLDVYIDDYSKPDPISPDMVRQMVQGRYIFDPPATRVNAQGVVEDVPPDEVAAERSDEATESPAEAAPEPSSAIATDAATKATSEAAASGAPDGLATAEPSSASIPVEAAHPPTPGRSDPVPR